MKRFYKNAVVAPVAAGFTVMLDGKPLRTPAKAPLIMPTRALADAIAEEWQRQHDTVVTALLPLTGLTSAAIDLVAAHRAETVAQVANFAGTDLVCYRAEHPAELVARQHEAWQPLIDWLTRRYDAPLLVTSGVTPVAQPEPSLRALRRAVDAYDDLRLAALNLATAACGSLVVALALIEARIDADTAFEVSQLDESFEIERWGEESEQTKRRTLLKNDIALAARFVALLRPPFITAASHQ